MMKCAICEKKCVTTYILFSPKPNGLRGYICYPCVNARKKIKEFICRNRISYQVMQMDKKERILGTNPKGLVICLP